MKENSSALAESSATMRNRSSTFGAWSGEGVSELKHISAEDIRDWAWRCDAGSSTFAMKRERKSVVPIPSMVQEKSGRHYLQPFNLKDAALEKILLKKMAT